MLFNFSLTDHAYIPEQNPPSVGSVPAEDVVAGRLSPIPEEPSVSSASGAASDMESLESLATYLVHDDPALQSCLRETMLDAIIPLEEIPQPEEETKVGFDRMPMSMLSPPEPGVCVRARFSYLKKIFLMKLNLAMIILHTRSSTVRKP